MKEWELDGQKNDFDRSKEKDEEDRFIDGKRKREWDIKRAKGIDRKREEREERGRQKEKEKEKERERMRER